MLVKHDRQKGRDRLLLVVVSGGYGTVWLLAEMWLLTAIGPVLRANVSLIIWNARKQAEPTTGQPANQFICFAESPGALECHGRMRGEAGIRCTWQKECTSWRESYNTATLDVRPTEVSGAPPVCSGSARYYMPAHLRIGTSLAPNREGSKRERKRLG